MQGLTDLAEPITQLDPVRRGTPGPTEAAGVNPPPHTASSRLSPRSPTRHLWKVAWCAVTVWGHGGLGQMALV
eukprot:6128614-Alexandrium_andersonii.AAC.1